MGDANKNGFPGSCPEFGAIFMSNYSTREECFRRKVFALPSSQSHFVKQVKAGMILFLFEFERRELYGVFQACSDGAMNILPGGFSLSGKRFPAQVKFTLIWYCHPLSENEFRGAIRENYFSQTKFNFGLSEDQVRRLLSLFSLKRMENKAPPRRLTESKVARKSGYSTSKNRRLVDKSPMRNHGKLAARSPMRNHGKLAARSPMRNQVPREYGVDNHHEPNISTIHRGNSFYNDDRSTGDGRLGTCTDFGYEHKASAFLNECFQDLMGNVGGDIVSGEHATSDRVDTEWKTEMDLQQAVSVGYSSGNFRSISHDVRFAESDRFETKCYKDDGFAPTISTAYPSSFQSKVNPLVYSSKHVLETDSFMNDPTRQSPMFLPSMEMQNSNVSHPINLEDQSVAFPYNPNVPTPNYRGSSSLGFNQGCASCDSFVGHVIGTSKNQSFPSLLETRRTPVTSDVNSGSRDFTLPYSNSYEHSSRTFLQRADYLHDLEAEYSKIECCGDLSLPKPSLSPVPPSEIRNNGRIGVHSSPFRTKPSKFPSITFSDRYPMLLQERHDFEQQESDRYLTLLQDRHDLQQQESDRYPTLLQERHDFQLQESKNDAHFGTDGFMFKECQPHGESFVNDNSTIEDGRLAIYSKAEYENKEGQQQLHVHEPINVDYHEVTSLGPAPYPNSDRRKKRSSVFSRLGLPPKIRKKESDTCPITADIDRHTSIDEVMGMLHQRRKHWEKTSVKPLVKHNAAAANLGDKKQATRKDDPAMISKEMNLKSTSFSKENSCEKTGETTFVDFKRRSAVRKNLEDGKTGNHCDTQNEKIATAAQCKRRKLIRPDFCESESSDRGISGDAPQLSILPSTECSVQKNAESIRVSVVHVNEKDISQNVKLQNAMCQTTVKGNNSDTGSGSNSDPFSVEKIFDSRSAGGGKESSKRNCVSSTTSMSCRNMYVEVEQDMTTKDTGMDGLYQDRNDVSHHSTHDPSPKICEDNDGDGVAKSEFIHSIEQMNDLTPGLSQDRNDVSHHSTRESSQKICEDNGGDGAAMSEFVYSIQHTNDLTPGLSQDQDDVSHHSTHESSQKICEDNDCVVAKSEFVYGIEQMNDSTPGLSQDQNDVSHHSTRESSKKICEDNDGDGAAKSEFVVCSIQQMKDSTPGLSQDQYDVNHHSTHKSSKKICEDNDGGVAKSEFVFGIEQMNLTPGLSQDRDDVSHHSTHESSQKCKDNDSGVAKSELVYSIEQMNDLTPGLSLDRDYVSHSTHESSQNFCEDNDGDGAAKSEFVYNIDQMNDLTPVGGEISISTLN
ncbi:N-terminal nucleophile aminohydrolases (Ntn hydrolases) superfamily protein isoform 1 [Hibiscus syriacus]|uniref:N-terminal nucleophile aminohydrolases (Ntn hydrolases) superfamily protein isoform 1 n=1 Tax=Hibiscus syriacus TaxID=106335 RepID=A0A6A3C1F1_HIBSY|nr:uncharacterized protein LOC120205956 isoform X2 [Hibiscus syriacus]KAE8722935.1 N-terminal nucleophile aminohydrolases (Ntn hydrolases) superfamily protein isoform 1 [Hibiscus syriacus]